MTSTLGPFSRRRVWTSRLVGDEFVQGRKSHVTEQRLSRGSVRRNVRRGSSVEPESLSKMSFLALISPLIRGLQFALSRVQVPVRPGDKHVQDRLDGA